jgi:hypothetical protein
MHTTYRKQQLLNIMHRILSRDITRSLCCCNKPMPRKSTSDDASGCRFSWYPRILTLLVSAGLGLSLYSSLDCKFLVRLGVSCIDFYVCLFVFYLSLDVLINQLFLFLFCSPGGSTRFHSKELSKR